MHTQLSRLLIVVILPLLLAGVLYYCFPGLIFESATHAVRLWAGLKRYELQVDDHKWVYLAGGEGETILFLHGFGGDKDRWGTFLPAFSRSYRLIVPDLPGFGESSRVASASYDIQNQVKRLNRFVETAKLEPFHLVGISMGGYISAYYASQYHGRVKSLALMDAAGINPPAPSYFWQRYKESGEILLLYKTPRQFDELMSALFHRRPWVPERFREYFANKGALNYDFYEKILGDIMKGGLYLLEGRLHGVKASTLLIWGANDLIINVSSVERFMQMIKNCQAVIIDQCGHVPYLEKPGETKRAYKKFLASLP